jgi:hypothetical protein
MVNFSHEDFLNESAMARRAARRVRADEERNRLPNDLSDDSTRTRERLSFTLSSAVEQILLQSRTILRNPEQTLNT